MSRCLITYSPKFSLVYLPHLTYTHLGAACCGAVRMGKMMTTSEATLAELAGALYDAFKTQARGDETITVVDDEHPRGEAASSIVYAAHAGMLPDDWTYEVVRSVLGAVHDGEIDPESGDFGDWADGEVDIYNHARLQWLANYPGAVEACDDASDGLTNGCDILATIAVGQYHALSGIASTVCDELVALFEAESELP